MAASAPAGRLVRRIRTTTATQAANAATAATSSSANGARLDIAVSARWTGGYSPREYHASIVEDGRGATSATNAAATTTAAVARRREMLRTRGGMRLGRGLRHTRNQANRTLVAEVGP